MSVQRELERLEREHSISESALPARRGAAQSEKDEERFDKERQRITRLVNATRLEDKLREATVLVEGKITSGDALVSYGATTHDTVSDGYLSQRTLVSHVVRTYRIIWNQKYREVDDRTFLQRITRKKKRKDLVSQDVMNVVIEPNITKKWQKTVPYYEIKVGGAIFDHEHPEMGSLDTLIAKKIRSMRH